MTWWLWLVLGIVGGLVLATVLAAFILAHWLEGMFRSFR